MSFSQKPAHFKTENTLVGSLENFYTRKFEFPPFTFLDQFFSLIQAALTANMSCNENLRSTLIRFGGYYLSQLS